MRLAEFQRRFQAAVIAPELTVGDDELAIRTGPQAFPRPAAVSRYRIAIHHKHFWSRMRDFTAGRHPLLLRALGQTEFDEVVRHYIAAHPPASFTPGVIVEQLATFLARRPPWSASPVLAQLARFDFQRSAVWLHAQEATVGADELRRLPPDVLAGLTLRLKRRSALATTWFRFEPERIAELSRDTALDDEPTFWLIYMAQHGCIARPVAPRFYAALQRLASGTTLRGLFDHLGATGFTIGEIDRFVDRCLRAGLVVAPALAPVAAAPPQDLP